MDDQPLASVPQGEAEVPAAVVDLAAGDTIEPVWRNQLGGMTFRLTGERGTRYVKWQDMTGVDPVHRGDVDLIAEAQKLTWAGQCAAVPEVLDSGSNGRSAWLLTSGINASAAYQAPWRDQPETAVRAIAVGLRRLHDSLPADECSFTVPWLDNQPEPLPTPEQLVVCHGDPCVPNTLISSEGRFAAHVDLGSLGVADRWADLAIATYSISWKVNFGRSYDDLFFAAYGVEPDLDRIAFYRQLWDDG